MVTIQVCIGSACHLKGSYNVINKLQSLVEEKGLKDQIIIKAAFCLGECTKAVSVKVNEGSVRGLTENDAEAFLDEILNKGASN
ncbi:NADH:ubiquinone oxidoreductase subunit E [Anaerosolibacter carboniphilus]|uniref:NADH:ubiquinone oxidoreductase subunit E n=1 Tax=Anaerosolibacter carboniphilus TaxID=1417629 RepID=A0A841L3E8_9FIRM|nr:NADH:ubiquinone oxidoreductase subunit E [Anaerosolibacter carboniphilus]